MRTIANLTQADADILIALAARGFSNKSFRVCRAMQEGDERDSARIAFDMANGLEPAARAIIHFVSNEG